MRAQESCGSKRWSGEQVRETEWPGQREKQQHVSSLLELLALRPRIVHVGPGMGNRPAHSAKGAGQETLP